MNILQKFYACLHDERMDELTIALMNEIVSSNMVSDWTQEKDEWYAEHKYFVYDGVLPVSHHFGVDKKLVADFDLHEYFNDSYVDTRLGVIIEFCYRSKRKFIIEAECCKPYRHLFTNSLLSRLNCYK